jgi:site-specific DNA-cytosine methylase
MNIVSLFDGVSCAYEALTRCKIPIKSYTAFEIDKYAIAVSKANHSDIIHSGDVKELKTKLECDILIGGSPCTDLSKAKKDRKGLEGDHSSLFWEYVRIKQLLQPKWFILENVASMKDHDKDTITKALGVSPIMINAGLVSAQRRKRYFWTNIPITNLPEDRGIVFKDIMEKSVDTKYYMKDTFVENKAQQAKRVHSIDGKTPTLCSGGAGLYKVDGRIRKLTPIECERLQGLPDNYTSCISNTQRYKCCGNAFNVDVVAHILSFISQN